MQKAKCYRAEFLLENVSPHNGCFEQCRSGTSLDALTLFGTFGTFSGSSIALIIAGKCVRSGLANGLSRARFNASISRRLLYDQL
jgi:hypothetical protein